MNKIVIIGLKKLPKPARQTDLLRQQEERVLKREIFETISKRFPFSADTLEAFYRDYPSFDLLIAACDFFATAGEPLQKLPPDFVLSVHCPKCDTVVGIGRGINDA